MADNTTLNAGSGGDVIATDDIGGVKYQRVKISQGADGSATDVGIGGGTEATALRVTVASDSTGVLTVDGTVDLGATDNAVLDAIAADAAAIEALLTTIGADTGNLAGILTALQIIDDWDESDRAKVNPIVGQAGVAAGAGAVGATVQRVTLASDDPAVTALQILDNAIAGSEMQVDVVAALPTGANTIGSIASIGTSVVPGTAATNLGKAEDAAHTSGDTGVAILGVRRDTAASGAGTDGDYATINLDANGRLYVNSTGTVAHDGADSGNPHKIGAKAGTSDQTAVANNDRTDLRADVLGHQVVRPYALHENLVSGVTAAITGTADTSVIAAGGAGIRNYITSLTVVNSHATVGTVVELKDGTTVIHRGYAAPAGGGYTVAFPTPLRGTANTAINAANVTTASNTYVSASGYRAAA